MVRPLAPTGTEPRLSPVSLKRLVTQGGLSTLPKGLIDLLSTVRGSVNKFQSNTSSPDEEALLDELYERARAARLKESLETNSTFTRDEVVLSDNTLWKLLNSYQATKRTRQT